MRNELRWHRVIMSWNTYDTAITKAKRYGMKQNNGKLSKWKLRQRNNTHEPCMHVQIHCESSFELQVQRVANNFGTILICCDKYSSWRAFSAFYHSHRSIDWHTKFNTFKMSFIRIFYFTKAWAANAFANAEQSFRYNFDSLIASKFALEHN